MMQELLLILFVAIAIAVWISRAPSAGLSSQRKSPELSSQREYFTSPAAPSVKSILRKADRPRHHASHVSFAHTAHKRVIYDADNSAKRVIVDSVVPLYDLAPQ